MADSRPVPQAMRRNILGGLAGLAAFMALWFIEGSTTAIAVAFGTVVTCMGIRFFVGLFSLLDAARKGVGEGARREAIVTGLLGGALATMALAAELPMADAAKASAIGGLLVFVLGQNPFGSR